MRMWDFRVSRKSSWGYGTFEVFFFSIKIRKIRIDFWKIKTGFVERFWFIVWLLVMWSTFGYFIFIFIFISMNSFADIIIQFSFYPIMCLIKFNDLDSSTRCNLVSFLPILNFKRLCWFNNQSFFFFFFVSVDHVFMYRFLGERVLFFLSLTDSIEFQTLRILQTFNIKQIIFNYHRL